MATATLNSMEYRPAPARPDDDRFVGLAAEFGAEFAPRAAEHDRDITFVHENFRLLRESGYTALPSSSEPRAWARGFGRYAWLVVQ
jgi:hypothetical protein